MHIVSQKNNIPCFVCTKCVNNRFKLCIPQCDEDDIVCIVLFKLGYYRNGADGGAHREYTFYTQAVLTYFIRPFSACKQRCILSGAKEIFCKVAAQYACAEYKKFHISIVLSELKCCVLFCKYGYLIGYAPDGRNFFKQFVYRYELRHTLGKGVLLRKAEVRQKGGKCFAVFNTPGEFCVTSFDGLFLEAFCNGGILLLFQTVRRLPKISV